MDTRTSRSRVCGFLHVDGRKLYNEKDEEIILSGVGFGNWLLPEGYMWHAGGIFDRPHRIEAVVRHLTGSAFASEFWKTFRNNYITRRDIEMIAEMGFNSIRIPINWRVIMEDEPGIHFIEEGFHVIDRCLDWCEEFNLYAILDLHGAPGGQTGSNIDDCFDDIPRLFIDAESRDKAIALWEEMARRYRDRSIVAAYDLLNEPLRTPRPNKPDTEYLHPELVRFYDDCIAAIRKIDTRHALSIEGANWASRTDTFFKSYDPQMIIHFHRYGNLPGEEAYHEWIETSNRLNAPIWLGESGENSLEWCTAMFPLGVKLDIGFNFWTWKKMAKNPSPLAIMMPENWNKIIDFTKGGPRPTYAEAQKIFSDYLENIKADNCLRNDTIVNGILRRHAVSLMATDFDTGSDSCSALRPKGNIFKYRANTGMEIKARRGETYAHGPGFDSGWEKLCLGMRAGEWALYSLDDVPCNLVVTLTGDACGSAKIKVSLDDGSQASIFENTGTDKFIHDAKVHVSGDCRVRVECLEGTFDFHTISLQ